MGEREPLALAKAMLKLGVKRFKTADLECEFHDAAIAEALTPPAPPREARDSIQLNRDKALKDQAVTQESLDRLLRSA